MPLDPLAAAGDRGTVFTALAWRARALSIAITTTAVSSRSG